MDAPLPPERISRRLSASAALTKFLGKATDIRMDQILRESREEDLIGRRTRIVCTMGPACWDVETLVKLFDAGLNICRFNFSHGDFATHGGTIARIREALKQRPNKLVGLLLDTKGPEIRTGMLKGHTAVELKAGATLKIVTDYNFEGDATTIACSYKKLPQSVRPGCTILMADGSVSLRVKECGDDFVVCTVLNSAKLGERKNMNLPNVKVDLPVIGEKDKKDLVDFAIPNGCHFIAASFVQTAADVRLIRETLGPEGRYINIIPKIENVEGILNFDEILAEADGIMVARGDMGMEIPPEKVFLAQKMMIAKCNIAGKPVITATQMLESMHMSPRPTRAEVADVANAVLDGTDCVMLSGETANGQFPVQAVEVMARICLEAESCIDYPMLCRAIRSSVPLPVSIEEAVCAAAVTTAESVEATLILALTETGRTAYYLAKYRPSQPIIALSPCERVIRQLLLHRGVLPVHIPSAQGSDSVIRNAIHDAKEQGLVELGDSVVAVHGVLEEVAGGTNLLKVIKVS